MVQITSAFCALLLVIPAFAAPVSFEHLEARDPNIFKSIARGVKKVATKHNIRTAARIASVLFKREDGEDLSEREVNDLASGLEDLVAREPNLHSFLHKVKRVATPHNIHTVANIVKAFVRREFIEEGSAHLVARDLADSGAFEDLSAREPNFRSFLHKVKRVATPHNIHTVAKIVKTFIRRDLDEDTIAELVTRSLAGDGDLEDLLAREHNQEHAHTRHHPHTAEHYLQKAHHFHHHAGASGDNTPQSRKVEGEMPHSDQHRHSHAPKKALKHRHSRSMSTEAGPSLRSRELEDNASDLLAREHGEESQGRHGTAHHHNHHNQHARHHDESDVKKLIHSHHPSLVARDISAPLSLDDLD